MLYIRDPTALMFADGIYFRGTSVRNAMKRQMEKAAAAYDVFFAEDALHDEESGLMLLEAYRELLDASQRMNFTLWPFENSLNTFAYGSYDENYDYVYFFMNKRYEMLPMRYEKWGD